MSKDDSADPLIGSTIDGRFEILSLLGVGGMGRVYEAGDLVMSRHVALKTLNEGGSRTIAAQRLLRECQSLARLAHPGIPEVFAYGSTAGGSTYIAMEKIEGRTLEALLAEQGKLTVEQAVAIAEQISCVLEAVHAEGIVHRDIKPGNIMLVDAGGKLQVKLTDFGIASLAHAEQRLTRTGQILGSPAYMSPEVLAGENASAQSDIYSLGCVLYAMLSGEAPYAGENVLETVLKKQQAQTQPLPENVPPYLRSLIGGCLEKDVGNRVHSAAQLRAHLAARTGYQRNKHKFLSSRFWRRVSMVAVSLCLAGAFIAFVAARSPDLWGLRKQTPADAPEQALIAKRYTDLPTTSVLLERARELDEIGNETAARKMQYLVIDVAEYRKDLYYFVTATGNELYRNFRLDQRQPSIALAHRAYKFIMDQPNTSVLLLDREKTEVYGDAIWQVASELEYMGEITRAKQMFETGLAAMVRRQHARAYKRCSDSLNELNLKQAAREKTAAAAAQRSGR